MMECISAITQATHDMSRAVRFYRMLGFEIVYGGDDAAFTSFRAGTNYLNLISEPTLTPSMRAWSRLATVQTRHRATPNGASGSSTWPTRMVTNSASLGRLDDVKPQMPMLVARTDKVTG